MRVQSNGHKEAHQVEEKNEGIQWESQQRENILVATRGKHKLIYKIIKIKIMSEFSSETMQAGRVLNEIFKVLK